MKLNTDYIGSCSCLTKTPAIEHHDRLCRYRLLAERDALAEKAEYWQRLHELLADSAEKEAASLKERVRELEKAGMMLRDCLCFDDQDLNAAMVAWESATK